MITKPANYDSLIMGNHVVEYKIVLNGTAYYNENFSEGVLETALFDELTVGTAVSRIFTLQTDLTGDFRTVDLYFRIYQDATHYTDWLPKGKYFVATQENVTNGLVKLTCYDAMQKANAIYMTAGTWTSPYSDDLVASIASRMGVTIDTATSTYLTANRFQITTGFVIGTDGTTMRNFLCYIGAVHCGGFIIDDYGKLKLWRYGEGYSASNYLVDSIGSSITFGGDRILV